MAGLSGKTAWIGAAKQTAKGTPASLAIYKSPFSGGNIAPVRETDRLTETDSSRDQGALYAQSAGVEGSPELYVRDKSIGFYLWAVLGNVVSTGTTPDYEHVITPGQNLPYLTFWKNVGGPSGLFEKYSDCFVGSLEITAEAGNPLTATASVMGLKSERLTTDPNAAVALDSAPVYNFNQATVELGGSATRLVRSFGITIENNVDRQQTDDFTPYDLSVGQREISLSFDMLFENLDEYNKFHYGGAAGTTTSDAIYTTSGNFKFDLGGNSIEFDLPSIAYEEFPVEPDPGGDPIIVSARAVAQKATGVTNLITATLNNQVATY